MNSDWKSVSLVRVATVFASWAGRRWPRPRRLRALLPFLASDPIQQARARGFAAGNGKRRPVADVRREARAIRDLARQTGRFQEAVFKILSFVGDYPRVAEFQKIVARLLHEMGDERALPAWLGVSMRFPRSMDSFHNLVVVAHRHRGPAAVRTIIEARFPCRPVRTDQLLAYAEACDLAGADAEKRAAFEALAQMFQMRRESLLLATTWLEEEVGVSQTVVSFLRKLAAGRGLAPMSIRDHNAHSEWLPKPSVGSDKVVHDQSTVSVRVLGTLFGRILEAREGMVATRAAGGASVCMLTGSLGAGGAERQFVNTALGLSAMSPERRKLRSGVVLDEVTVVARSLRDRKDGTFFLGELQAGGVPVSSYRELPDFSGNLASSAVRPALTALGFLPWSTAEAVIKLTDRLRMMKPEVVHIWQDGLVYAAGLAALLAGVPRIILSGRSTPPPDRRARYPVEYDIIYKSLLRAPGVKLSVNSHHAAKRYSEWLGIDPGLIAVVHNGVEMPALAGDDDSANRFQAFDARTRDSRLTIGAVMRLDEVKRPLLWMDVAAAVHALRPDARFILVGDGPLRTRAERRAEAAGIIDRCLFVGRSSRVGYWLSKMDALMLLSEHEGLPNALIEAQMVGVPVITTPVGGAVETLRPGKTGLVTSSNPSPGEVAAMIADLAARAGLLQTMGANAQRWASHAFTMSGMLTNTLQVYDTAGDSLPLQPPANAAAAMTRPRSYYMED